MLERHMIQARGFKKTPEGFSLILRSPYYRGFWASSIESLTVEVDGVVHSHDSITWTLDGASYSAGELAQSDARWALDRPARLAVRSSMPLPIGLHDLRTTLTMRMSYIPLELQPTDWIASRSLAVTA